VPFSLNVAETVPALMAGNTVVLKPAQLTPRSGSELGRIVAEATDIPAGVFNVVVSNANGQPASSRRERVVRQLACQRFGATTLRANQTLFPLSLARRAI
jgi:acyl-CoA reductase-like NAD-dependent aldehyde dehydrogenase